MIPPTPTLSIVVPLYNEEALVMRLRNRLAALMDNLEVSTEVVLVDDGSRDRTPLLLAEIAATDDRFAVVTLSRNFGHQIAITAGMDFARGQALVVMDGDLQDPPEVIPDMLSRWRQGHDIVYGIRSTRAGETLFKRASAAAFYKLFRRLTSVDAPPDVGDFRLIDRRALEALRAMREQHRYIRGMIAWVGFRQTGVEYQRDARDAGTTKYPLRKMLGFASDAILSFSAAPLRAALQLGFAASTLAFLGGIAALAVKLAGLYTLPGWASLIVVTTFIGGIQLVVLGVVGEYVARIYEETRRRPLYIVQDVKNLTGPAPQTGDGPWFG